MRLEMDIEVRLGAFHLKGGYQGDAAVLGVFGPSGAGKTTLLHLLAGLLRPNRGRIVLDGQVLCDSDARAFVPAHRRHIGMVFQDTRLFPHLSVRGNLQFARRLARARATGNTWDAAVAMLELDALLDRRVGTLSGGERQRVALGRALLSSPRLLLLDEPVAAVDAGRRAHILPMLRKVARDLHIPMVVVSHELPQLLYLTDRLLLIENGRSVASGPFVRLLHDAEALRLLRTSGITNLLHLRADRHLPAEGITLCSLSGSDAREACRPLRGPLIPCVEGTQLTATLRPEEIILSLAPAEHISAQNQMPGRIKTVVHSGDRVLCCVDVGTDLFVDVTHHSAAGLDVTPGGRIWCLFKTHAVRYLFEEGEDGYLGRSTTVDAESRRGKEAQFDGPENPSRAAHVP